MTRNEYLKLLVEGIHSTTIATIGADGHPQTRVIDMMLYDERGVYFLTAKGRMADGLRFTQDSLLRNLIAVEQSLLPQPEMRQLSLFDDAV